MAMKNSVDAFTAAEARIDLENIQLSTRCKRRAFWLDDTAGGKLFCWLHTPMLPKMRAIGIIISNPVGPEYMHSHRSLRYLADILAEQGFAVLRYDPQGMGNSTLNLDDPRIPDAWPQSISAGKTLYASMGIDKVVVIALRSSALVVSDYLQKDALAGVVYWYPYLNGNSLLRDMQIIDAMLHMPSAESTDIIEGGGYPFYAHTQHYLTQRNILKSSATVSDALIINNAALPPNNKLAKHLASLGANVTQHNATGVERMMKQSELTVVPEDNITAIRDWLLSLDAGKEKIDCACSDDTGIFVVHEHYREQALVIPGQRAMFGILTEPTHPLALDKPVIVFANGGSGHHVGPNRLYVDIARKIAALGFRSVRLDLSNLGDSASEIAPENHHPYMHTAADDIVTAMTYLAQKLPCSGFVLSGLCSGAHNVFHAALSSPSSAIREIILINPLTFYWRTGDSILLPEASQHEADVMHYSSSIMNSDKWMSLLTNPKKLISVGRFSMRLLQNTALKLVRRILRLIGVKRLSPLEQSLNAIHASGTTITVLSGNTEPGYRLLRAQAGALVDKLTTAGHMHVAVIQDGDHTFSSLAGRKNLIKLFVEQLQRY